MAQIGIRPFGEVLLDLAGGDLEKKLTAELAKIADLKRTIAISMTRTRDAVAGVLPSSQVYLGIAP